MPSLINKDSFSQLNIDDSRLTLLLSLMLKDYCDGVSVLQITMTAVWLLLLVMIVSYQHVDSQSTTELRRDIQRILQRLSKS